MTSTHESGTYYWEVGAAECPHAPEPNIDTNGEAWDLWSEQHPVSDDVRICLSAPAGTACLTCSAEDGEMVAWDNCHERAHTKGHGTSEQRARHERITVDAAALECLERECEEFYDDNGEEIPGKETCSHFISMDICAGCSEEPTDANEFPTVVAWDACPQRAPIAA